MGRDNRQKRHILQFQKRWKMWLLGTFLSNRVPVWNAVTTIWFAISLRIDCRLFRFNPFTDCRETLLSTYSVKVVVLGQSAPCSKACSSALGWRRAKNCTVMLILISPARLSCRKSDSKTSIFGQALLCHNASLIQKLSLKNSRRPHLAALLHTLYHLSAQFGFPISTCHLLRVLKLPAPINSV